MQPDVPVPKDQMQDVAATFLPSDGLVAMMKAAAEQEPFWSLVVVLCAALIAVAIAGYIGVRSLRYFVLRHPPSAKVLRLMEKDYLDFRREVENKKAELEATKSAALAQQTASLDSKDAP